MINRRLHKIQDTPKAQLVQLKQWVKLYMASYLGQPHKFYRLLCALQHGSNPKEQKTLHQLLSNYINACTLIFILDDWSI